jgi:hypothetical protein
MSITIAAPVESIFVEKRTWHQDLDVQGFLGALEAGTTRDFDNDPLIMKRELAEGILSYIDSKEAFVALVDEYIVNEELYNGYDVYTVDRNQLFTANRELLEDFIKPDWVKSGRNSDWVEFLYDSIAYYGIGEIGYEDVNSAFIEGCIEDENEQDAWHMGCYAINNHALHTLMVAYGVHTGKLEIVPPKPTPVAPVTPVAHKNTQVCAVTPHSFDSARLIFASEVSNDGTNTLLDTDVFIGDQTKNEFMLNIKGDDIEAFKQEFHALMTKYHA